MTVRTAKAQLRLPHVKPRPSALLDPVVLLCQSHGLPAPLLEFAFAESADPPRRYRADYAWLNRWVDDAGNVMTGTALWYSPGGSSPMRAWHSPGVILEVQGGIWRSKGAHNTGTAMLRDMDKFNLAQTLGFLVILASPQQVQSGDVLKWLRQVL